MSDPFALLGLPRRPWLEDRTIRAAFQERARRSHPDAEKGDADVFADLNAAQAVVANPANRLRFLIGDEPIPAMPTGIQLGFLVAAVMRKVEVWREKERAGGNVLVRALLAQEAVSVRQELDEVASALEALSFALEARLRELDELWPDVSRVDLAALAGEYMFLSRWQAQAREAFLILDIAFG